MNMRTMGVLFKREIRDIFRDKKTLIMMIVVPLLLYPLLIVGMTLITSFIMESQLESTYTVAYVNIEESTIAKLEEICKDKDKIDYDISFVESTSYEQDLQDQVIDAYIIAADNAKDDKELKYEIHYMSAKDDSYTTCSALKSAFEYVNDEIRDEKLKNAGIDIEEYLNPVAVTMSDVSSVEESFGNTLGGIIPMLIITSICLGAIYPAIDVTAGERERGTLETLLTLPVTNFEMIMSKFLAVSTIASISAMLNIFSMGGAFAFMFQTFMGEDSGVTLDIKSFIPAVLFSVFVMMIFAFFVTAVCMCTCVFAKSFKEANNYITPVLLVFMFGGYSAMLPNLELNTVTAAIPIINITQLIKSLFSFQYNYGLFGIVLISNLIYSVLTIMVLAKIYNSETVLFAEGFTNIKIFTKRSEMKKGQTPGVGDFILLLCVVLLAMFYVGSYATLKWGFYGIVVQQGMILILPLLYAFYLKCDFKKTFSIKMPRIAHIFAAVFVFLGGYGINLLFSLVLTHIFPSSAETVNDTFAMIFDQPFILVLFAIAILPAIGEELLFRGFVFTSIREKCKPISAILIVSAIFGIYHMSLIKFFTTAFLGVLLALLAEGSGSIFCGMVMHFLNNGVACILSVYGKEIGEYIPFILKEDFSLFEVLAILIISIVLLIIGFVLLFKIKKSDDRKSPQKV